MLYGNTQRERNWKSWLRLLAPTTVRHAWGSSLLPASPLLQFACLTVEWSLVKQAAEALLLTADARAGYSIKSKEQLEIFLEKAGLLSTVVRLGASPCLQSPTNRSELVEL